MANIFLTRKCNLKCPYCFADEFVNKANEEYTLENVKKVIDFIKTDKEERIGLIGGEPALYPYFSEVLSLLNNDDDVKNYIIFTNGLEIDKFIEKITNKKVKILINCNSPIDLGERYNKLKNNIKMLVETGFPDFTLGINLYSSNLDYSYIFDLLSISKKNNLRFSTSLPNTSKEDTKNALKNFLEFKPFLFKFFTDCYENEVVPYNDCNSIPSCILTVEDKRLLIKIKVLADKYKLSNTINTSCTCKPVIDILPDLKAVRCFGFSKELKVPISDFKNIKALRKYFYNKIDLYAKLSFESLECEDCKSRLYDKCGLCYTYKIKRMNKIKEFVSENIPQ